MSSLQDFAQLKLQDPGELQPQQMASASPVDPNVSPPVDQIPVAQGGAPVSQPPMPASTLPPGPVDPAVTNAVAQTEAAPEPHLRSIRDLQHNAEHTERQAEVDGLRSYADQAKIARDKAGIAQKEYDAQAPIMDRQLQLQNDAAQKLQMQQQTLHDTGTKAMGDYQQTVNALTDKIANQPHDIFGRAGVNKASGIIGLILGGLSGSANGGKNAGVERLNQLTEQNLNQQKYEYDMLRGKADMQNNQYAMLRQQGMDDIAATNTVLQAKMSGIITQMEKSKASFAPMKANNEADQTIATLKQNLDSIKLETQRHIYGQAVQAKGLELQQEELADRRAEFQYKAANTKPEAYDNNPIEADFKAPSADFAQKNRIIMPRMYETNADLKLLKEKYEEFKRTTDSEEKGVLRDELASLGAQIETGIPNPAEPQIEAAKRRMGVDTILGVQRGRFNSSNWEHEMIGKYVRAAYHSHYQNAVTAGFIPNKDGQYMRQMKELDAEPGTRLAEERNKGERMLDENKRVAKSVGRGVLSSGNAHGYVSN